jgi:hypothetical protein
VARFFSKLRRAESEKLHGTIMWHLGKFSFFVVLLKIISQAKYIALKLKLWQDNLLPFHLNTNFKMAKKGYPIWIDRIPLNFSLKWSRSQDINEQRICFNTKTNWEKNNRCLGLQMASTFHKSSFNLWKLEDKLGVFETKNY